MGLGILGWIVVGLIAGYIAEKVMQKNHGLIINLIVGVVGALLGGWLAGVVGLHVAPGFWGTLIVAIVGAIILLFGLNLVRGR